MKFTSYLILLIITCTSLVMAGNQKGDFLDSLGQSGLEA